MLFACWFPWAPFCSLVARTCNMFVPSFVAGFDSIVGCSRCCSGLVVGSLVAVVCGVVVVEIVVACAASVVQIVGNWCVGGDR